MIYRRSILALWVSAIFSTIVAVHYFRIIFGERR